MNRSLIRLLLTGFISMVGILCPVAVLWAQAKDSLPAKDSLRFPIRDRRGDRYSWQNHNPFDLNDSSFIKEDIQYDPKTNQYYILEKVGKTIYREPTYLTFEEYYLLQTNQSEAAYFKQRADALAALNKKTERPKPHVYDKLFDRIFGVGPNGLKVDIKPQGSVDLSMGYQGQNTLNPTLPEAARKTGGLDFNMNANMNVNANIGDKLKFPINYNTLANFDYLNKIKLNYKGMDDEIIRSIEAGNISFQTRSSLISGVQDLFGIKTQLQFGKLSITSVFANQRSQQQTQSSSGGSSVTTYKKKASDYDENRNFLMAQYFNKNFKSAMSKIPVINSQVTIQRIEVWVTNRTGATTDTRMVVGLMDLGEAQPYNSNVHSLTSNTLPSNGSNDLYASLTGDPANRNSSVITTNLTAKGLSQVNDFEKVYARKLAASEYYFNPQVGFISLNAQLQPDDVLAVAYQYTYNGRVYQVGEFSQDIALDSTSGVQQVLFLKLLKATAVRTQLPIWNLMMKNVYSLDMSAVSKTGFKMDVMYQQTGGALNKYLPESAPSVSGKALLSILNLDRLNSNNDPQPDGIFDFVDSLTILSKQGKIIFPELQPFGRDLDTLAFAGQSQTMKMKYVFYSLYDTIKAIAQTNAQLDKFYLQGQAKGSSSSSLSLGAYNVPQGSVKVTANGQTLTEGVDYTVDYNLGAVTVINQSIINSGVAVNVSYENGTTGMQQKGFMGLRLDYAANKKLSVGATIEHLTERPYFSKVNYGEDPISNTLFGTDFSYQSNWPGLTRALNKLPFYSTKAPSSVAASGEVAYFKPGQAPGTDGSIYVDDFEGTTSNIDLRFPLISWALASTPSRFPEATLISNLDYGKNRAKLAWYNIEPTLQDPNSSNNPLRSNLAELSDPRVRLVYTNELFPQTTTTITNTQTTTFDIAYYPTEIGPYNYESSPSQVDANGNLKNPKTRWGGLMRAIDQTDFETNNIDAVEFWVQDPFIKNPTSTGGTLYMDLGEVSEDILKDGKHLFENGLSTPNITAATDTSIWGKMPLNPVQVTNSFSNDASDRPYQDVGFDGLDDDSERVVRSDYLKSIQTVFGTNSPLYQRAINDPSNDDYVWYRDSKFDAAGAGILERYKNYNNPQGNSAIATGNNSSAATTYPDNEDINHDNIMNETEAYYEYAINLNPGMTAGTNQYISDERTISVTYADGHSGTEKWYQFRIPIKDYTDTVGQISDFKSIRFVRLYLSGFEDSVVCRFAEFNLVRSQWRQFNYYLDTTGSYTTIPNTTNTTFNTISVNLEENSSRTPVNYVIPPGINRVQTLNNNGVSVLENEQSLSLQISNLADGDARAVYKTVAMDFRQYGKLSMFAHAESVTGQTAVKDNELNLVVRIGQDYLSNYYEIKIPLKITAPGFYTTAQAGTVWPAANNLDFSLQELIDLKKRRNGISGQLITNIYREIIGNKTFSVMGNPNLGEVEGILIAVENAKDNNAAALSAEVWVDELRLSEVNNHGAYAALGKVDVTLADLGKLSVSGSTYSQGWGALDSHINDRLLENQHQFDAVLDIDAGKLLPKSARLSVPMYTSISRIVATPEYDPFDLDIKLSDKINAAKTKALKDSIKNAAFNQLTVKTINFTNVHILPKGKTHLWSLSNFNISYSLSKTTQSDSADAMNNLTKWRVILGYNYQNSSKFVQPFRKVIKSNNSWWTWLKDFNFNLKPSLLSFKADINRLYGIEAPRVINTDPTASPITSSDTTYNKYFTFDRYYAMHWDLSRSLNFDFSAVNYATVDEPYGLLNTKAKRDTLSRNFWKGGRTTNYQQTAAMRYIFPLNKLPLTDWVTASYTYGTSYNWIGASRLAITLGNTLENSQTNTFASDFDFTKLYAKSRWLKPLNTMPKPANTAGRNTGKAANTGKLNTAAPGQGVPLPSNGIAPPLPSREEVITDKYGNKLTGKKKRQALQKWRQQKRDFRLAERLRKANQTPELKGVMRAGAMLLTMVKHVGVSYSEDYQSTVPGFMDSTQFLGQDWKTMQPGLDYIFGKQPDTSWLNKKAAKGFMTNDSSFNSYYAQNYAQKLSITAQLEPIRDMRIDVSFDKSFSKNYSELFKDTLFYNNSNLKEHLNPLASGGFSVSWIGIQTLFRKSDPNRVSDIFQKFEDNRIIVSNRLASQNPYWTQSPAYTTDGYAKGYGRYSQDVLIPAFLAAYTGKSPYTIALVKESSSNIKSNPFGGYLPKPNWRLSYSGLNRIPALAKIFSAINITNAYSGILSMNSYTSSLTYSDVSKYGSPGFIDTVSGNYVPFYVVPNVSIQEQFSPLIGVEATTVKQWSFKFVYNKSRQLSLSLVDYQMSETNSKEWIFGFGWRKRGIRLPFKIPGMQGKKLQNDLSLKLDISLRDDATGNSTLDQTTAYATSGQKVFSLQPSVDYVLNNRINLKLYFTRLKTTPYISTTAPTVSTTAGLQVRISLAP